MEIKRKPPTVSLLRSLNFRITAPIVILMIVLWASANFLVLASISNSVKERIHEDLQRASNDVYNACDTALQKLMMTGRLSNEVEARVQKGKVLGEIELYARQNNNLQAIVYTSEGKNVLLNTGLLSEEATVIAATKENGEEVSLLRLGKENYYARRFQFELWNWDIILLLEGKAYEGLIYEVQRTYAATGVVLLIACFLLAYYLRRVIQAPIQSVIKSIQTNEVPRYKGIYEFEFLSDNIREATEKQREEQLKISYQATHDALTGLVNRGEFERRLESVLHNPATEDDRHTILYLDLDQFKIINDTCGHIAGDELLRQVTDLLQSKVRQSDTLARLGGDEFGVLLENCPLDPGMRIADSLRTLLNEFRFTWTDKTFPMGVSIGVVNFGNDEVSRTNVLSLADSACYVAKDSGRNRIHVYHADDKEVARHRGEMDWIGRIQKALDENRFVLYMQRIAPLQEGDKDGEHYELLIRMLDEEGKLIPPIAFIPAAERYNLMPAVDRWVIKTAFSQYAKSHGNTRSLRFFAINLSGASIGDSNTLAYIREQLALYKVPPATVCFEITETSAIANMSKAVVLIEELKAIGCRFALDDFGSGMSSFAYLKHLAVDFLKIDGGFVKNMVNDPIDRAMVDAINNVGHVMGIRTIAEFVENDAILQELRKMGVDYAQGYGIAKPCLFVIDSTPIVTAEIMPK
ncbi:MAG: EAL domain-containing protein [Pseudomonadota bacterium]